MSSDKLTADERTFLATTARKQKKQLEVLEETVAALKDIIQKGQDSPAFIDQIHGRRVPYLASVLIAIPAASLARAEGRYVVPSDGPFVIQGLHLTYERTSGPYANKYVPATTVGYEMAEAAMQLGFQGMYNNPIGFDCDIEIADTQTDRAWQNIAFPSSLCSYENNCMYYFPVAYLATTNTTIQVFITPKTQQSFPGTVRALLLGYKIVQGASFQP